MKFSITMASLIAGAAVCVAPALANGASGPPIRQVFLSPVLCDSEAEAYTQGAFSQWVSIPRSSFTGLTVGMTDPDDDFFITVGDRLCGPQQGKSFGPPNTWTITQTATGDLFQLYGVSFNLPGEGIGFIASDGNDAYTTTSYNSDGSFTVTANYSSISFPPGSSFVGIYVQDYNGPAAFTSTVISAKVDGVTAQRGPSGRKGQNGFLADCGGYSADP